MKLRIQRGTCEPALCIDALDHVEFVLKLWDRPEILEIAIQGQVEE
jgi:hypothetical protein